MAKLTYQNVNAPNWNITGGLALANATLGNALKGFSDSLGDFKAADQANADAILRERMLGLKTEDDFYNALQSGSLLDGISGRITAKAAETAWKDRNDLLNQDANRLQYNIDTALAGASDLQSAIEMAATNGDRRAYNQIINSEEFKALPVQAQQKLLENFDQIELNRARTASIGRTNRATQESSTMLEELAMLEDLNNREGSLEQTQKNSDYVLKKAIAAGYSPQGRLLYRKGIPTVTSTGYDSKVGGNIYDPGSLKDNFDDSLDSIGRVTIKVPNKDDPNKYTEVNVKASELLQDRANNLKQENRTIASNFGFGSINLSKFYDTASKSRPEIIKTVKDSYGLNEEQTQDFSEEVDNIQKRYGFSEEDIAFGISNWGMQFPENADRLYEAKKQRGFSEAISAIQSNEKSIKSLEDTNRLLKIAYDKANSSFKAYKQKPVTINRKMYQNDRRAYEDNLKKSTAILADVVKRNQERNKIYQNALKVDRNNTRQFLNEDIANEIIRKNMQNINTEIEKFNSLNR